MSKDSAVINKCDPGPRDIVMGRGNHVFNHIANRRYRKVIDLHVEEYVNSVDRSQKTYMVRKVIFTLLKASYRFLKPTKEKGNYEELDHQEILRKVGHSLRDRSPLLRDHLNRKLKTRAHLLREKTSVVEYAEILEGHDRNQQQKVRHLWLHPSRDQEKNSVNEKTDDNTIEPKELNIDMHLVTSNPFEILPAKMKEIPPENSNKSLKSGDSQNANIKLIDEIVIPTLKAGSMPVGGNWQFFPLPKLNDKVNLGVLRDGWQLILQPITNNNDPIVLDVPL